MAARNPAYRRYLQRMAVAAMLYVAAILVAVKVLHHNTAVSPWPSRWLCYQGWPC